MLVENIVTYGPLLVRGAVVTLGLWLFTGAISLTLGGLLGILNCNRLHNSIIAGLVKTYIQLMKGVPLYVLLLINCFILPPIIGLRMPIVIIATLTLGLSSAAYMAEIIRSGINAISMGQWEASTVLGYNTFNALHRIILPQMIRNCIPGVIGELDQQIKSTSLFATVGVVELTRSGMTIIEGNISPLPVYLIIALFYFVVSVIINQIGKKFEQKRA